TNINSTNTSTQNTTNKSQVTPKGATSRIPTSGGNSQGEKKKGVRDSGGVAVSSCRDRTRVVVRIVCQRGPAIQFGFTTDTGRWTAWTRLMMLQFLQLEENQHHQVPNLSKWTHRYFCSGTVAAFELTLMKFSYSFKNFNPFCFLYKKLNCLILILLILDSIPIFHISLIQTTHIHMVVYRFELKKTFPIAK